MRHHVPALALMLIVPALLATLFYFENQTPPSIQPGTRAPAPPSSETPVAMHRPSPATTRPTTSTRKIQQLYRCEASGHITYQSGPCPVGSTRGSVESGAFSVVNAYIPPSTYSRPHTAQSPRVQYAQETSSKAQCDRLLDRLERNRVRQRAGGSANFMQGVKFEARALNEQPQSLRCSRLR